MAPRVPRSLLSPWLHERQLEDVDATVDSIPTSSEDTSTTTPSTTQTPPTYTEPPSTKPSTQPSEMNKFGPSLGGKHAAAVTAIVCTCVVGLLLILGLALYIYKKRSGIISSRQVANDHDRGFRGGAGNARRRDSEAYLSAKDVLDGKGGKDQDLVIQTRDLSASNRTSLASVKTTESEFRAYLVRLSKFDPEAPDDWKKPQAITLEKMCEGVDEDHAEMLFDNRSSSSSSSSTLADTDSDLGGEVGVAYVVVPPESVHLQARQIEVKSDLPTLQQLCGLPSKAKAESISDTITLCTMSSEGRADSATIKTVMTHDTATIAETASIKTMDDGDSASIRTLDVDLDEERDEYKLEPLQLQMSNSFQVRPIVQRLSMIGE